MGWRITNIFDRDIVDDDIQKIVDNFPIEFSSPLEKNFRQPSGWHTGVDIGNPDGKRISISGSYGISGDIAKPCSKYIREELKKMGYVHKRTIYDW